MILLADFGNTRVKVAVREQDGSLKLIYSGPVDLDRMKRAAAGLSVEGGMWCSVREPDYLVREWMESLDMTQFTASTPIPIRNDYSSPRTLGMDRLAAAVGAWSMQPGNDILVVDAGTAVTFDLVSADGAYKGGNIAPGIELRFKALHEYTDALPLVNAKGEIPLFGNDTATAIRSGVVNGIRHELYGFITRLSSTYPSLLVFLTGGDAGFFDIIGKSTTFAVPDLVLRGLARVVDFNEKQIN